MNLYNIYNILNLLYITEIYCTMSTSTDIQPVESVNTKIVETIQKLDDLFITIKDKCNETNYKLLIDYKNSILSICNTICDKMCKCVSGGDTFCNDNIDSFIKCNNLQHILLESPILQNIIIMNSLPDIDKYDITKYIQLPYIKYELDASINCNLLDININININKMPQEQFVIKLTQLFSFADHIYKLQDCTNNFTTMCIHIAIFDITFKNSFFIYTNSTLRNTILHKLNEGISRQIIKGSTRDLSMTLINKIYNRIDHNLNIYSPYFTQITNYINACGDKNITKITNYINSCENKNITKTNTNTNSNIDTNSNTDSINTDSINIEIRRSKRCKRDISYKNM